MAECPRLYLGSRAWGLVLYLTGGFTNGKGYVPDILKNI